MKVMNCGIRFDLSVAFAETTGARLHLGPRLVVATRVWDGTATKSALHFYRISHSVPELALDESEYFNQTIRVLELSTQRVTARHTKMVVAHAGVDHLLTMLSNLGAFSIDEDNFLRTVSTIISENATVALPTHDSTLILKLIASLHPPGQQSSLAGNYGVRGRFHVHAPHTFELPPRYGILSPTNVGWNLNRSSFHPEGSQHATEAIAENYTQAFWIWVGPTSLAESTLSSWAHRRFFTTSFGHGMGTAFGNNSLGLYVGDDMGGFLDTGYVIDSNSFVFVVAIGSGGRNGSAEATPTPTPGARRLTGASAAICNCASNETCVVDASCINGGLGCNAHGIPLCRFCDFNPYNACNSANSSNATACHCGAQSCEYDPACAQGGMGCNATGHTLCRFCGFAPYANCSDSSSTSTNSSSSSNVSSTTASPNMYNILHTVPGVTRFFVGKDGRALQAVGEVSAALTGATFQSIGREDTFGFSLAEAYHWNRELSMAEIDVLYATTSAKFSCTGPVPTCQKGNLNATDSSLMLKLNASADANVRDLSGQQLTFASSTVETVDYNLAHGGRAWSISRGARLPLHVRLDAERAAASPHLPSGQQLVERARWSIGQSYTQVFWVWWDPERNGTQVVFTAKNAASTKLVATVSRGACVRDERLAIACQRFF